MMLHSEFLSEMENILDMPGGSITGTEVLKDCAAWDSLAILAFSVFVSERLGGSNIPTPLITGARTVDDLYALLLNHVNVG